jgi:hypothetical protein
MEKAVVQTTTKMPSTMKVPIGKWNSVIMGQKRNPDNIECDDEKGPRIYHLFITLLCDCITFYHTFSVTEKCDKNVI